MKLNWTRIWNILIGIAVFYIVCSVVVTIVSGDPVRKTIPFANGANMRLMVSISGKNGKNTFSYAEDIAPSKSAPIRRFVKDEETAVYEIVVLPIRVKGKSKAVRFTWTGLPKGIGLVYQPGDRIVWYYDE